jgi:hypothetical protein
MRLANLSGAGKANREFQKTGWEDLAFRNALIRQSLSVHHSVTFHLPQAMRQLLRSSETK